VLRRDVPMVKLLMEAGADARKGISRIRLDPDPIIDRVVEALFTSEVSLGRLHRGMSR
jgi:hypothetical protein